MLRPNSPITFGLLVAALGLAGCRDRVSVRDRPVTAAAPSPSDHGRCTDLADLRVCWVDGNPSGPRCVADPAGTSVCSEPQRRPAGPRPVAGWRCTGQGSERSCRDRRLAAGRFECSGKRCTQRYPRMPDDGEWECIDLDGAVLCRRGVPAAGVIAGPPDPGWFCGARTGGDPGERVCVDFDPDLPEGATTGWRCRYDHQRRERRICTRRDGAPALGAPCDPARPCPSTLDCVAGRCLPSAPSPSCWFDKDCPPGSTCRLATCTGAP